MFQLKDFPIGESFYWVRKVKVPHLKEWKIVYTKIKVDDIDEEENLISHFINKKGNVIACLYEKDNYLNPKKSCVYVPEKLFKEIKNGRVSHQYELTYLLGQLEDQSLASLVLSAQYSFHELIELSKKVNFK